MHYDLDAELKLKRVDDAAGFAYAEKSYAIPKEVVTIDEASVLIVDEKGRRWRFPKGDPAFDRPGAFVEPTLVSDKTCVGGHLLVLRPRSCREIVVGRRLSCKLLAVDNQPTPPIYIQ